MKYTSPGLPRIVATRCGATNVNPATALRDTAIDRRCSGHRHNCICSCTISDGEIHPGDALSLNGYIDP